MVRIVKLALIFFSCNQVSQAIEYNVSKFEHCTSSNESVFSFDTCVASPTGKGFNVLVNIKQPLDMLVYIRLFSKQGEKFRQMFKIPKIDWCDLMKGVKKANPITKAFLKSFNDSCPNVIRPCPYFGKFELQDFKLNRDLMIILPKGILRTVIGGVDGSKVAFEASMLINIWS